ncbi:hypothetical protein GCM10022631_18030 [Deinococcus rubellus]
MDSISTTVSAHQRLRQLERRYGLVVMLNWFAATLPSAVIVLYAQSRGLTLANIGLYVAVYSATVALLDLPTGNLADVVGRKRVALASYSLAALARLILLFAVSLPGFICFAVVWGLARALGSGALEAWFVSSVREIDPEANLQPRLARINTRELLAISAGSLIGAALPTLMGKLAPLWIQQTSSGAWSPLAGVVACSLLLHLATLGVTWRVVHEPPLSHRSVLSALQQGFRSLPSALREAGRTIGSDRLLLRLLTLELVTGLMLAASETYWQPFFATRFGLGGPNTVVFGVLLGGCFLAGTLGNICAGPLIGWLGGRVGRLGMLTQVVQAGALLTLAWQGSVWLAAGLFWLTYFARTAFSSPFMTLYNGQVPDGRRSLMLSVLSVAMFVGVSVGNLVLGAVSSRWSISWAWTLMAGVLLLSIPVVARLRQPETQSAGR